MAFCNDITLLLFPETEDPVRSEGITILIIDNVFAYDLKVTEILKYKLIFQEGLLLIAIHQPVYGRISFRKYLLRIICEIRFIDHNLGIGCSPCMRMYYCNSNTDEPPAKIPDGLV